MKKLLISTLTAAALVLTACSSGGETAQATATPAPTQEPAAVSTAEATPAPAEQATGEEAGGDIYAAYVQEFEQVGTMVRPVETDDGRALDLECILDDEIDQLIYDSYRNELLGDLDGALALVGNVENYRITVENAVRNVQEGAGNQSYTLHEMHILPLEEVQGAEQRYLDVIAEDVADCGLTQWTVQEVDVSWTYTEAEKAKGPQLDEGRYQRYFLLGKAGDADSWKIYDCFWENFLPEA